MPCGKNKPCPQNPCFSRDQSLFTESDKGLYPCEIQLKYIYLFNPFPHNDTF